MYTDMFPIPMTRPKERSAERNKLNRRQTADAKKMDKMIMEAALSLCGCVCAGMHLVNHRTAWLITRQDVGLTAAERGAVGDLKHVSGTRIGMALWFAARLLERLG